MARLSRTEQRELTRTRLLDAAEKVFIARGFHITSVDEIAEEAGFSKGAVYSNFESKDDLFLAVLERKVDSRSLAVEALVSEDKPIAEQAVEAGDAFFDTVLRQSEWNLLLMEFSVYSIRHPELREQFAQRNRRMRATVVGYIEKHLGDLGLVAPMSHDELAAIFFALGVGIRHEHLIDPDGVPDTLFGKALALMLSGLQQSQPTPA